MICFEDGIDSVVLLYCKDWCGAEAIVSRCMFYCPAGHSALAECSQGLIFQMLDAEEDPVAVFSFFFYRNVYCQCARCKLSHIIPNIEWESRKDNELYPLRHPYVPSRTTRHEGGQNIFGCQK